MTTIAFVGNGPLVQENAIALLNDYFGITEEDSEGFPIWPDEVDKPTLYYVFTEPYDPNSGFAAVLDWSEYAVLPFYAIVDERLRDDKNIKTVTREARDVQFDENPFELMVRMLPDDSAIMLLRIDQPATHPPGLASILIGSIGNIPIYDLTAGLMELSSTPRSTEPVEQESQVDDPAQDNDEAQTNVEGFYEEDEPVDKMKAAFDEAFKSGEQGIIVNSHDYGATVNQPTTPVTVEWMEKHLAAMEARLLEAINFGTTTKQRGKPRE